MPVHTPHPSYRALESQWQRLRDCFGGRDVILARGTEYLPSLPGNPTSDYGSRANFYNAVKRTVQGLAGAITQDDPTFNLPDVLKDDLPRDLARPRQSGAAFVKRTIDEVLLMGRWGVLVDLPADPAEGQHAYWYGYHAEDIRSWTVEEIGGQDVLTRVVLREVVTVTDPKDPFAYYAVVQYRVLSLVEGRYQQDLWRENEKVKDEWVVAETSQPTRRGIPLDFVPFVFCGPTSESPEPENPPLIDLADINIAHWRNSADHEYGLHLVALPTPWVSGVKARATADDPTGANAPPMAMGPSVVWEMEAGGQAGMLEFGGQGLGAIREAMAVKERQMATLGARLLEEQSASAETATAVGMRHAGEHATLRTVAQSVGDALTRALQIVVWWMGTTASPEDEDVSVDLNPEFFQVKASPDQIRTALTAVQGGQMSFETFYEILQKGLWARDGVSAEEEMAQIDAEEGARANADALRRTEAQLKSPPPTPPPGQAGRMTRTQARAMLRTFRAQATLEESAARAQVELLRQLRRDTLAELKRAGRYRMFQLTQLLAEIDREIAQGAARARSAAGQPLDRASRLGGGLVDNQLPSRVALPPGPVGLSQELLTSVRTMAGEQIGGVWDELGTKLAVNVRRAVLGVTDVNEAIANVAKTIRDVKTFATAQARAETIIRTEVNRTFSMATQARLEQSNERLGGGLRKWWLTADDARVRTSHEEAGERYSRENAIPIDEPFLVGGASLMEPLDPTGPPEETINCRCRAVPDVSGVDAAASLPGAA